MIVLWDLVRIYVQSRWLVRKLNQKNECPRCQAITSKIDAISKKLGIDDDSKHSGDN